LFEEWMVVDEKPAIATSKVLYAGSDDGNPRKRR
jgi:hypothetical protein